MNVVFVSYPSFNYERRPNSKSSQNLKCLLQEAFEINLSECDARSEGVPSNPNKAAHRFIANVLIER